MGAWKVQHMTIRHFKIFYTICKCGSMTAAAKALFMTQPSVSHAVLELEKHYNTKLFERQNNRLAITEYGKVLLEQCEHVLPIFSQAEETMFRLSKVPIVSMGASATVGTYVLPEIVKRFTEQVPDAHVYTLVHNTAFIIQKILDGDLVIGFVEGETSNPNITKIPFMKDELVAICNTRHELAARGSIGLEDLDGVPVLLREKGSGTRIQFEEAMRDKRLSINAVGEHFSSESIINYVSCNHAVGIVSVKFQNTMPKYKHIKVFEIPDEHFHRIFSIVYHRDTILTPELSALISLAKALGE